MAADIEPLIFLDDYEKTFTKSAPTKLIADLIKRILGHLNHYKN